MSPLSLVMRPAVRPNGLAARAGLVLLVALAGPLVAGRLRVPPAVRTVAVGSGPLALAVDGQTRRVFVANFASATVSMLDAGSGAVLATTPVIPYPETLAIATAAGRVFAGSDDVTLAGVGRVSVLDATSGRRLRTVAVGRGAHLLAAHEGTGHVFVTNGGDDSVSLLDAHSGQVLRTIPLGLVPLAMAVDERTNRVFLLTGSPSFHPYPTLVSLLDARSGTVLRTVPVGTWAGALAVDERTGQAFVSNPPGGTVLVLDGRTAAVVRTLAVPLTPGALAVAARTGTIVGADIAHDSVSLVAAASRRVARTVPVGLLPWAIAVDQRRGHIVVLTTASLSASGGRADQVQVLDGQTGRLLHTVAVGTHASALAVDERTGTVFAAATNLDGIPAGSDSAGRLQAWLRRWLPRSWVSRLLPPPPAVTTGTVTMLDPARVPT